MPNKNIRQRALAGHLKRCTERNIHPNIAFIADEKVIDRWRFVMKEFDGTDDEYKGGVYFGTVIASNLYPFDPPRVTFKTPTGVYPINESDFCVDMGHYHKNNYPPTLGMDGFVKQLWAGLIGWRGLIGGSNLALQRVDDATQLNIIKTRASESRAYNLENNSELMRMFGL